MTVSLSSCEISEPGLRVSYDVVAIDSVQMPATLTFGETYDIPVFYKNPSSCHVFDGFNVSANLNERTISTVLARLDSGNCIEDLVPEEQTLSFTAASNGSYIFKFFRGLENNVPVYIEHTVFVLE